jgi:hypothetical protein
MGRMAHVRQAGRRHKVHVSAACGCEWDEKRPHTVPLPKDGEFRVCAQHYPQEYPVTYSDLEYVDPE